jgi:putative oxidoreductase
MSSLTSTLASSRTSVAGTLNPLQRVLVTTDSAAPLIARLTLGLIMFPHGAQKALGWFGGYGYSGTMGFFTGTMHIPAVFAFLAIAAEFAGSLALIAGAFSRVAALGIAGVMTVAIATSHLAHGFFMNWTGTQQGEGFEFHLLALGLAAIVMIHGGGKASIDARLTRTAGR